MYVCVCVCECVRVSVCVSARERKRGAVTVSVCVRECECVCVDVSVCAQSEQDSLAGLFRPEEDLGAPDSLCHLLLLSSELLIDGLKRNQPALYWI